MDLLLLVGVPLPVLHVQIEGPKHLLRRPHAKSCFDPNVAG
jgi:hypothetical protein